MGEMAFSILGGWTVIYELILSDDVTEFNGFHIANQQIKNIYT